MKIKIFALVLVLLAVSGYGFAADNTDAVMVDNKICPISGDKIGKGEMGETKVVEYNGKKYNLCCAMCEKDFMKDPAAAVNKIEEQMSATAPAMAK